TARALTVTPDGAAGIRESARARALGSSRSAMTIDVSDGVFRDASAAAAPISPAPKNRTRIDNTLAKRTGNRPYTKITTVVTSRRSGLSWRGKAGREEISGRDGPCPIRLRLQCRLTVQIRAAPARQAWPCWL